RVNIRRSSQNHNIRTEASTRLEKFLDPNLVDKTLARCLELLQKYAGAKIISRCDYYLNKTVPKTINFNYNEVKRLTGVEIPQNRGIDILRRLDFQVVRTLRRTSEPLYQRSETPYPSRLGGTGTGVKGKNNLKVTVPTIRADIEGEADLVEEIVRIYGYDKLPSLLIFEAPPPKIVLPNFLIANICRRILTACGFNEAINLPIINDGKLLAFGAVKEEIVFLVNPPGHDFNALRTSLIPGLSDNINISRQNKLFQNAFFEIGRVFKKDNKGYREEEMVAGAIYNSNFRFVKGALELLCKNLGINEIVDNRMIEAITVKNDILFFELPVKELINAKKTIYGYKTIPLYPPIIEDLTFLFNGNIYCSDIIKEILSVNKKIAEAVWKTDYNENSLVARTFTVIYQSPDKTLSNEEIAPIRKEIVTTLEKKFGARLKGKV
ncbi:MAG: phenylalanine--tRNA ligase beta subunit-related protein, partial [bacterium]|nr:phenylalanine--tRNA ligase beta subunit-related protein [bacterium]